MLVYYVSFLILSLIAISLILIKLAPYIKLLDYPDGVRKIHKNCVPLTGGFCIFYGLIISSLFKDSLNCEILLSVSIIFFLGIIDDMKNVKYYIRFLIQIIISVFIVYSNALDIQNSLNTYAFLAPVLVLFIIVVINSFNFIDGIDGLTLSLSLVCLTSLFISGMDSVLIISLIISCSVAFLFNMSIFGVKHKFFLGDSGSTLLGYLISIFIIKFMFSNEHTSHINASFILLILVPLFDLFFVVFFVRILAFKNPFKGDRKHIHHVLKSLNFSDNFILIMLISVSLLFSILYFLFNVEIIKYKTILLFLILYFVLYLYLHISNRNQKL